MKRALVFLAVIFCAAAAWYVIGARGERLNQPNLRGERTGSANVVRWRDVIRNSGAVAAYAAFAKENESRTTNGQHEMAHWFGAALYLEEGADGLSVCDSRFAFGCYHEFLGQAIADLGIESVFDMNERCHDALGPQWLSCQHGIGHGVQTYFGYERTHLDDALAVCRELPYMDPIGGCYGGVFMEYNVRTMLGLQAEPRLYEGEAHTPCNELAYPYKLACYYWQPQWWTQVLYEGTPDENDYAEMGSYCEEIDDRTIKGHCYEGIGNITEQNSGRDPVRARELCDAVSDNAAAQLYCRSVAANHFGLDVSDEAAKTVCGGLEGASREYCLLHGTNKLNVMTQGTFPLEL